METIKVLLDHGADIHVNDDTLIAQSIWEYNYPLTLLLLSRGASLERVIETAEGIEAREGQIVEIYKKVEPLLASSSEIVLIFEGKTLPSLAPP